MSDYARGRAGVDILGNAYGTGDVIAAAINSYGAPTMLVGRVVELHEDRITVDPIKRTNGTFTDRNGVISPERVVLLQGYAEPRPQNEVHIG